MKSKKTKNRRNLLIIPILVLTLVLGNTTATFATSNNDGISTQSAQTLGTGRWYLGSFTFTNINSGASRTINGNRVKLSLAWKPADIPTSKVNINVSFIRTWTSEHALDYTFDVSKDTDGPDSDGYYYLETGWFTVNPGSDYHIYYDVVTAPSNYKPGTLRSASVHTWVDVKTV